MSKNSSGGSVGGLIFFVLVLIAMIPKEIWISLGIILAVVAVTWIIYTIAVAVEKHHIEAAERARIQQIAHEAAVRRERLEQARRERQHRIDTLGADNAALLESAMSDVTRVSRSEAARAGWLGDVDFSADLNGIRENFEKAHALHTVTAQLAALDKPSAADRTILAEATTTIAQLERAACERVELIGRCAIEAQLIDQSLRTEREDARNAEQRAVLHGKLSAMLYGIEAAPAAAPEDSAVDAVMARVQAYREIKNQILQAREG